jgi:hypothetical protein
VPAVRIVPALDEVEDCQRSLALRLEAMLHEKLAFKRAKETLAHRVIVAVSDGSHRRPYSGFFTAQAEGNRRVLCSLIGVMNDALRPSTPDRHVERLVLARGHAAARRLLACQDRESDRALRSQLAFPRRHTHPHPRQCEGLLALVEGTKTP